MLKIINDIKPVILSSQLGNIIVETDSELEITFMKGGYMIWGTVYVPDDRNRVTFMDAFSILEPYMDGSLTEFTMILENLTQKVTKVFRVLLCRFTVTCTAADFLQNYFLSALAGRDKITVAGRQETLYLSEGNLTSSKQIAVTAECRYIDSNYHKTNETISLGSVSDQGVQQIDVSPSKFVKAGKKLISYTVVAGNRRLRYRVEQTDKIGMGIRFKNSFGLMETVYFVGLKSYEPEIMRSFATISGKMEVYHIKEKRQLKANTGFVADSMLDFFEDVARSPSTYMITETGDIPLIINDSDTKHTDSSTELVSFVIKFSFAEPGKLLLPLLPDIFDDSFDDTYN